MKFSKFVLLAVLTALPLTGFAKGTYYAGAGLGLTKFEDQIPGSDTEPPVPNEITDSDVGYKIFGGYRFTPNWSAELGLQDYGSANGAYKSLGFEMEATGLYLTGFYHWNFVPTWSLDLSLGLARAEGKSRIDPEIPIPDCSFCTNKDSVWGLTGGLGLGWRPTEHLGTRLQFELTTLEFDDNTGAGSEEQFKIPYRIGLDIYWMF